LNLIQTIFKKYFKNRFDVDKNLNSNHWNYRKYTIILDDDLQCIEEEKIKTIFYNDLEEIRRIIHVLKNDNNNLLVELKDIKMEIKDRKAFFNYLKQLSFD
jgi:hypothetical protein